jgi:hypothetical protein
MEYYFKDLSEKNNSKIYEWFNIAQVCKCQFTESIIVYKKIDFIGQNSYDTLPNHLYPKKKRTINAFLGDCKRLRTWVRASP